MESYLLNNITKIVRIVAAYFSIFNQFNPRKDKFLKPDKLQQWKALL